MTGYTQTPWHRRLLDALGLEQVGWMAVGGPDDGSFHDNAHCSCEEFGAVIEPVYRLGGSHE